MAQRFRAAGLDQFSPRLFPHSPHEFAGAVGVFPEDVVDVPKSLFKHGEAGDGGPEPVDVDQERIVALRRGQGQELGIGAAGGQFELNTAKPLIAHNMLQSLRLLTDGMRSFEQHCVRDMTPDRSHIAALLSQSLMLVTALSPHIGHDRAAAIAQKAQHDGSTLREAALATQLVTAEQFDEWVRPERMV